MPAQLLDGKILAGNLKKSLSAEILSLKELTGTSPQLINLSIGQNHSSCAYANSQRKVAEEIGVGYELVVLPTDITQESLIQHIHKLNRDDSVNGIMIHKPVPAHIHYRSVANHIDITKDLEGINVANIGKMLIGETQIVPCTPAAVMEHIKSTGINLRGKEVVIVGHSEIVGKPLSLLLLQQYATVTVC
ncbi:MAG: bifunctional 5,10-methylenetetrahydrofolate dehydrogenase/5,10-methenyltetrahydrofolate cyclohydrolase, partial [Candidatus Omnitrophota bacterium]